MAMTGDGKVLRRADPSTIQDKFMVGYQGWFTCPGDGKPLDPHHHGWLHWFNYPIPDGGRPNTDLWPDVSEYSPSELFPAPGLKLANGEQTYLFSSRHPKTVQRHFHWMALHGVDGAFLQRFAGQCDLEAGNETIRNQRDEVGDRVREAAEKEGRVFAIMYDVSGVAPDRIQRVIEQDWLHLIHRKGVLDSPSYLRERGKAVVTLWGFGFSDSRHDPATLRAITAFLRNNTPGGAYIMAGTPAHWRTSVADADSNPDFVNVWLEEFDAISPWTIGRYGNLEDADRFLEEKIKGDLELIRKRNEMFELGQGGKRKVDYIPVVFPGGSGFNLSEGKWGFNDIKRRGGNFLWRQLFNVRRQNVRTIYGAMWDEYDEGTAFMPVVQNKRQLPVHEKYNFMGLDEDGFDLPPDWYMRICGFAVEGLRGERLIHETFPSKELQDYWSTRPRYEESSQQPVSSGSGGGSEKKDKGSETWEEWDAKGKGKELSDEPPPPPYTLEDDIPVQPAAPVLPVQSTKPVFTPESVTAPAIVASAVPSGFPHQPPITPLSTRPTLPPSGNAPVLSGAIPPAVMRSSRPASIAGSVSNLSTYSGEHVSVTGPSRQSTVQASQSVSVLADEFSRHSLTSSPSPQLQPAQPNLATRPTSPLANQATKPHVGASSQASLAQYQTGPTGHVASISRFTSTASTYPQHGTSPAPSPVHAQQSSWPGQQPQQGSPYPQPSSSSHTPQNSYANSYNPSYAPSYGPPAAASPPQSYPSIPGQPVQHAQASPFPGGHSQTPSVSHPPPAGAPPLQHAQSQPPFTVPHSPISAYPSPAGAPPLQHAASISGYGAHQHTQSQSPYPGALPHTSSISSYAPPTGPPPLQHTASYPGNEPGIGGFSFPTAPQQQQQQDYYGNPIAQQSQYQQPSQQPYQQPGQYNQYGPAGYPQPGPGSGGYPYQAPGSGPYGEYPSYPSYY